MQEWQKLDGGIKERFKKILLRRQVTPHVQSARLSNDLHNCYKIKLMTSGYRLVYEVNDLKKVIVIIAVGKRAEFSVYKKATFRR